MATSYTSRGWGLVNESDDPYDPDSTKSSIGLAEQKNV